MATDFLASALGSTTGNSGSGTGVTGNGSSTDMFTTLLVAQIRNQNPLEPTDPSQFVNQLTQLSQMEALQSMSTQSSNQASMLQSLQVLALGAQVGSSVSATTDTVQLGTDKINGSFTLDSLSTKTAVVLTGTDKVDHRIELSTRSPGDVAFTIDPAKLGLPPGTYSVRVDTDGKAGPPLQVDGTLTSVRMSSNGSVVLDVNTIGPTDAASVTGFNGRPTPLAS
ncbi:MAG: flagellar basal body rod modification protein [Rhizobacter sp.]|nr:flagellar basal body rod modification protein [Rhizobacter sp.]